MIKYCLFFKMAKLKIKKRKKSSFYKKRLVGLTLRKSRSFLPTLKFFSGLINKVGFHGTNESPTICIQKSLSKNNKAGNWPDYISHWGKYLSQ